MLQTKIWWINNLGVRNIKASSQCNYLCADLGYQLNMHVGMAAIFRVLTGLLLAPTPVVVYTLAVTGFWLLDIVEDLRKLLCFAYMFNHFFLYWYSLWCHLVLLYQSGFSICRAYTAGFGSSQRSQVTAAAITAVTRVSINQASYYGINKLMHVHDLIWFNNIFLCKWLQVW